jgi:hypothetical protein
MTRAAGAIMVCAPAARPCQAVTDRSNALLDGTLSWRWVPTCLNVFLCHLWQVIRDVVPRRLKFYVDVLVWPDEGIIVESARWYLEPGLRSF